MRDVILQFANVMDLKLSEKDPVYGETWLTMPLDQLQEKLSQKIEEYEYNRNPKDLIHIANFCAFVWWRRRQEKQEDKALVGVIHGSKTL